MLSGRGWTDRHKSNLFSRLFGRDQTAPVRGLYLWGNVGRGKTLLVDMFFACLPFPEKLRVHFHTFMRQIHQRLKKLRDQRDPLEIIAHSMAAEHRLICLDEFHVGDITDAMILGNLIEALFAAGVTLIATSNEAPDDLYHGGLQRERFLPAIDLIKTSMQISELNSDVDYRLRALERAEIYHVPLDAAATVSLRTSFDRLAPEPGCDGARIEVNGRQLTTMRHADGIVWFEFNEICGGPRAAADYIEIARCYQTVMVSDIPRMDEFNNDAARRLVNMIDEFYDRNVKFICSADVAPDELYTGKRVAKLFRRTASRLVEMQSHDYLARAHSSD